MQTCSRGITYDISIFGKQEHSNVECLFQGWCLIYFICFYKTLLIHVPIKSVNFTKLDYFLGLCMAPKCPFFFFFLMILLKCGAKQSSSVLIYMFQVQIDKKKAFRCVSYQTQFTGIWIMVETQTHVHMLNQMDWCLINNENNLYTLILVPEF